MSNIWFLNASYFSPVNICIRYWNFWLIEIIIEFIAYRFICRSSGATWRRKNWFICRSSSLRAEIPEKVESSDDIVPFTLAAHILCIVVYCNLRHSGWFDWQWRISNWRTKERRFPKWCSRNFVWYALKYSRRMLIPNHIDELHKRKYFMRISRFCSRYARLTYEEGTKSMAS